MKKTGAILLALSCLMCFAGCDTTGGGNNPPPSEDPTAGQNPPIVNPNLPAEQDPPAGEQPPAVTFETYGSYWFPQHDYKTMPVAAYNSCPPKEGSYSKNFLTDENLFISYVEAGVNTIMGLTDFVGTHLSDVETALNYCYDYDLAYLLAYAGAGSLAPGAESSVRSTLARVMHHDNFAGIMLSDEPGRIMFESIATSRKVFENVLNDTSTKLYHANLFPTYASEKQLYYRTVPQGATLPEGGYSYAQYVKDYMEIYKPQVLSYDFYPITDSFPTLADGYFDNMSIIRSAALEANIPFWTYIQTCSYKSGQRLPTEADMLWNVNTCLAYGAKGIEYFCGVNPNNNSAESFKGSMFDYDGNPTEVYDLVAKANKQIAAVDEVLMCSKSKGLMLFGEMPLLKSNKEKRMNIPQQDLLDSFGNIKNVTADHLLIGCFDYNGKTALYVVNNAVADDDFAHTTAAGTAELEFTESANGYYVQNAVKAPFSGNKLTLTLAAGEGVLVVIE